MSEQLPDKKFERLAKLVGDILAKRWMQILARHGHANVRSRRPAAKGNKKPKKD